VDARHQFRVRTDPAAHEQILRSILEAPQRPLAVPQQAHRDLVAGAFEPDRIDVLGLRCEQARDLDKEFVEVFGHRRRLDHELATQLPFLGRAGGVVGESAALADLVHQRRAHAFAEQRSRDDARRVVVAQRRNRVAEHDMGLAAAALPARGDAADVVRRCDRIRLAGRMSANVASAARSIASGSIAPAMPTIVFEPVYWRCTYSSRSARVKRWMLRRVPITGCPIGWAPKHVLSYSL
jgi:hypothetical protein